MAHHLESTVVSNVQKDVISDIFPVPGFVKIGDLVKEITLKMPPFMWRIRLNHSHDELAFL